MKKKRGGGSICRTVIANSWKNKLVLIISEKHDSNWNIAKKVREFFFLTLLQKLNFQYIINIALKSTDITVSKRFQNDEFSKSVKFRDGMILDLKY